MNKQEAIEKLTEIANGTGWISHKSACNVVVQIHEPQKVVVPKFIADKIEYCKNTEGYGLFHAMDYCFNYKDSADWLECNQETFAQAWLFGYKVEKEKLYTVEIPNPNIVGNEVFALMKNGFNQVVMLKKFGVDWKKERGFQLTESEIKQDFGWAWQFAVPVEVK
ncbi:DUF1642 domain-containing protein [Streptococcus suis]|uniref:DUF1642 domain-containing protein n=1 Tax=Streptococcus suis TaxID=1307 RepID=UPI003756C7E0